jgi:ankyrin repeat protein
VWWSGRDALLEPDGAGSLPLHLALSQAPQPSSIIPFLIYECPESSHILDASGSLPLHLASRHPTSPPAWDVVDRLVRLCPEALLAVPNADGSLALHLAVAQRHQSPGIVRMLVEACPESVRVANSDGSLPLHLAVEAHAWPSHDIVRALVEAWPDSVVATRDVDGLTALHLALLTRPTKALARTHDASRRALSPFGSDSIPRRDLSLALRVGEPPRPATVGSRALAGVVATPRRGRGPPAARGGRQRAGTAAVAGVVVVVPGRRAVSGRAAARFGQREVRKGGTGAGPKGGGERRPARRDFLPDDAVGRLRRSAMVTRLLPTVASGLDERLLVFDSCLLHQLVGGGSPFRLF